jgi:hypothetical protein
MKTFTHESVLVALAIAVIAALVLGVALAGAGTCW